MGFDQSYYPRASLCLTQAVMIKKYISSGISLLSGPHSLRGKWHLGYRLITVGHTLKKAFYLKISFTKKSTDFNLTFFLITSKTKQYTYIIIVSSYGGVCVCVCVCVIEVHLSACEYPVVLASFVEKTVFY